MDIFAMLEENCDGDDDIVADRAEPLPLPGPIVPVPAPAPAALVIASQSHQLADDRINGYRRTTNGVSRVVWEKHITTSSGKRRRVRCVDPTGGVKTRGESCARAREQGFANRCA